MQPRIESEIRVQPEPKEGEDLFNCTKCKLSLPVSAFYKKNGRKRGVQYECKACTDMRRGGNELVRRNKKQPEGLKDNEKWCPVCDTILPVECYYKAANRPDGLTHSCRNCHNGRTKKGKIESARRTALHKL